MEFNPGCKCCTAWQKKILQQKIRARLSSRKYYAKNKEKVILSTLKRYYSNQKDDGRRAEER